MPVIRVMNQGDTDDALATRKFNVIPARGALVSMAASCVTSGDTVGLSVGEKEIVPTNTQPNIEIAADVIDIARDGLLNAEPVPSGQLYAPVSVTTALNFQLNIRYL